ncbi:MAG: hypothetical protein H7144_03155 [Burkholderiales bacterium]|nr:hypothetical protein [Phycisphaerae bacterium]
MQRRKPSKFKWFVRVAVLGVIVWFVWSLFGFHVTESRGPCIASKAESITGLTLPPESKNIRAASYSQWIEYAQYLRFEAPVDVCVRYASTVVPGAATQPADEFNLKNGASLIRSGAFDDFSWFDLDKAQNVVTAGGGPSQAQVWVDQTRGVFYYRKTD